MNDRELEKHIQENVAREAGPLWFPYVVMLWLLSKITLSVEVFLHHSFGKAYLSIFSMAITSLIMGYFAYGSLNRASDGSIEPLSYSIMVFFGVFLIVLIFQKRMAHKMSKDVIIDPDDYGYPIIREFFPKLPYFLTMMVIEPLIVFFFAYLAHWVSFFHIWLNIAACGLIIKAVKEWRYNREQDYVIEKMRAHQHAFDHRYGQVEKEQASKHTEGNSSLESQKDVQPQQVATAFDATTPEEHKTSTAVKNPFAEKG